MPDKEIWLSLLSLLSLFLLEHSIEAKSESVINKKPGPLCELEIKNTISNFIDTQNQIGNFNNLME